MAKSYEDYIAEFQGNSVPSEDSLEAGADAMAFVSALYRLVLDPDDLHERPDLQLLENYIDAIHGELTAAAMFLSENGMEHIPKVLRAIGEATAVNDESNPDGPVVPVVVRKGFTRLAKRIEGMKVQKSAMQKILDAQKVDS